MKKSIYITAVIIMLLGTLTGCAQPIPINVDSVIEERSGEKSSSEQDIVNISFPKAIAFNDNSEKRELREQNEVDESIINSVNGFSFDSTAVILKDNEGNACYSPLSLYLALAVLSTGAEGETKQEITALLGENDTDYLSQQMGKLFRLCYMDNDIAKLNIANSLWINEEHEIKKKFADNAMDNFYAAANNLDFSDDGAGETISQWISDNTGGMLKADILTNVKLIYIVNTIYFNDEWEEDFKEEATEEDIFYTNKGQTVNAHFMNRELRTEITQGEGYTAASLDMKNTGRMVFVLPNEGVELSSLLASPSLLAEMANEEKSTRGTVDISIPKFDFQSSIELKDSLERLGIKKVFDDSCDLSGISDYASCISEVNQINKIEINENGIEAASYTHNTADSTGDIGLDKPIELKFDRPFIFIVQSKLNVPLFIGVVQNPV